MPVFTRVLPDGRRVRYEADQELTEAEVRSLLGEGRTAEELGATVTVNQTPLERFGAGLGRTLNPMNLVEAAKMLTSPTEAGQAIIEGSQAELEAARAAHAGGRPAAAVGHVLGAIPLVGPPIASEVERMAGGDVAGGLGGMAGLALPVAAGPLGRGALRAVQAAPGTARVLEPMAAAAQRGVVRRLTDVMAPTGRSQANVRLGDLAARIAPQLAQEPGLWALGRPSYLAKVEAGLDQAGAVLDATADARGPLHSIETPPVEAALQARLNAVTAPAIEASRLIPTTGREAFTLQGRRAQARPFGEDVIPAPYKVQAAVIQQAIDEVHRLGPTTRYGTLLTMRQGYDQVAKRKYLPSVAGDLLSQPGAAEGAADVTGALRTTLAASDPQAAEANATYHLYASARDVMKAAEQVERVRPRVGRALLASMGTALLGTGIGGGMYGSWGAAAGSGLGAIAGPILDRLATAAPTTKILAARQLQGLAQALRGQHVTRAGSLTARLAGLAAKSSLPLSRGLIIGATPGLPPEPPPP